MWWSAFAHSASAAYLALHFASHVARAGSHKRKDIRRPGIVLRYVDILIYIVEMARKATAKYLLIMSTSFPAKLMELGIYITITYTYTYV